MEHLVDGGQWQRPDRMAEMSQDRCLCEGALGSEERHLQRLLLREACWHDLAEEAQDFLVPQRTRVALTGHAEHLGLTLGPIEVDSPTLAGLGNTNPLRQTRAVIDQLMDLLVDRIDLTTN